MLVRERWVLPRVPITAVVGVFLLGAVDILRTVSAGGSSLSGVVTLAIAGAFVALAPTTLLARQRRELPSPERLSASPREPFTPVAWRTVPLGIKGFILCVALSLATHFSVFAAQNAAVYAGFVFAIALVAYFGSTGTPAHVLRASSRVALIASLAFLASTLAGFELYGERSFAAVGLIYLAILIPVRHTNTLLKVSPYIVTAAIVLSLSRTAALIAVAMLVVLVVRGRRGRRLFKAMFLLGALVGAAAVVIWNYAPFRARFFGGDNAIQLSSGATFNTSGRDRIWSLVIESWQKDRWLGNGIGSAQALVTDVFQNIAHPHNEYLRILHDFGIVGLVLFSLGMLALLASTVRRAYFYDSPEHWAATLAIAAVLLLSITDNPLVYVFVMVPTGMLVGLSLSSPPPPKRRVENAHDARRRRVLMSAAR